MIFILHCSYAYFTYVYANGADFVVLCFSVIFADWRTLHTCPQTELILRCCCLEVFSYFEYVYANGADLEVPRDSLGGPWGLPGARWEAPGAAWGVLGGPLGSPRALTGVHKVLFRIINTIYFYCIFEVWPPPGGVQGVPRTLLGAPLDPPNAPKGHLKDSCVF